MWGNCLKCYSEIIKISAISIDTRYKPWNYGFAFRGVQGGGGGGGGMGLPWWRVQMIGYQLSYAIFQVSFQLMMH